MKKYIALANTVINLAIFYQAIITLHYHTLMLQKNEILFVLSKKLGIHSTSVCYLQF
jgi:hypothetical protein